ncbi:MAG: hypothetical protein BXU00_03020 [Candidatus Nanoclepta minutus]|uniref:Thioredoxin-like fold domain-containing protein n=1 Tax=Candidatus Nanoclepta minutus TaxID=1940235 RepID=A0A397WM38_9ARCH|nr:MAG: hypothetical protein BXU00_03020 [Candidatus Nanoclepta minutus]
MAVLSDSDKEALKKIFEENLNSEVEIEIILDYEKNPEVSKIAEELFTEIKSLSNKILINFVRSDIDKVLEEKKLRIDTYGNRKGPIIIFSKYPNIVWYGLPAGEEFPVFLEQILHISSEHIHLPLEAAKVIHEVSRPLDILIFVTPTCPYCPIATHGSSMFSMVNKNIRTIIVEATEFPELSEKFNVYAVPKIAILGDGKVLDSWEGALPEVEFARRIKKVEGS